ncbi:UxaA family hydrolase [Alicyclobacillus kakegawensis]|uniref:UxaA family hydrolase n=1 Tax=Alicyclobacillus kakegawensis TaxID=392012 RepID=UPI000A77C271|nr:UxaA family hydrolase [Alicyclobacillus kakegawensis]
MRTGKRWIVQNRLDDVATALVPMPAGEHIVDVDLGVQLRLLQDIPFGHKFSVREIAAGEKVHKYGQVIGRATKPIRAGEHVHVHNLESLRGRGDLQRLADEVREGKA